VTVGGESADVVDLGLFDVRKFGAELLADATKLGIPEPKSAIDQARAFGGWTIDKLDVEELYFKLYRRVAGNGSYIDGFAGEGPIRVGDEVVPGSAARALRSGAFKQLRFYELPRRAQQLREYLAASFDEAQLRRCMVQPGDFNQLITADLDQGLIPKDKPCFAFLDPDSTQLDWQTVEVLADYKAGGVPPKHCKIELWILFNTHQALIRLVPRQLSQDYARSASAVTLDRVMGGRSAWWDLAEQGAGPGLYAARYCDRLEELGYRAARPHRILDPRTRKPQYFMIQASDHPAAFRFMRWAEKESAADRQSPVPIPGLE
jgi:three-Cys-motif partner protein